LKIGSAMDCAGQIVARTMAIPAVRAAARSNLARKRFEVGYIRWFSGSDLLRLADTTFFNSNKMRLHEPDQTRCCAHVRSIRPLPWAALIQVKKKIGGMHADQRHGDGRKRIRKNQATTC
jgi:hypothetical protein